MLLEPCNCPEPCSAQAGGKQNKGMPRRPFKTVSQAIPQPYRNRIEMVSTPWATQVPCNCVAYSCQAPFEFRKIIHLKQPCVSGNSPLQTHLGRRTMTAVNVYNQRKQRNQVVLCGVALFTSMPRSSGSSPVFVILCIVAYGPGAKSPPLRALHIQQSWLQPRLQAAAAFAALK